MHSSSTHRYVLIESVLVIAILGILAGIAIPAYQQYTRRGYYEEEIVVVTEPYRAAVEHCAQQLGTTAECNAGMHNIPTGIKNGPGPIETLTVTNGVILVKPVEKHGLVSSDIYVLTPAVDTKGNVTWVSSGGAVAKGYAR
jgi:type IV pilus assembly protein PilA